jgi:hypothetical protein
MANVKIRRKTGASTYDVVYPSTDWSLVENKPTTFTPTSHTHGNISNGGAIGTTSNLVVTTTTSGVLTTSSRSGIDSRTSFPAASHTHGDISNDGVISSTPVTAATGDYLLVSDSSGLNAIKRAVQIGTGVTTFLRNDGIWAAPTGTENGIAGDGTENGQVKVWNSSLSLWQNVLQGTLNVNSAATATFATTAGSATSATSATTADNIDGVAFRNTGSNSAVSADTLNSNGITYYTSGVPNFTGNATDGALYSQIYSSSWQHQIAGDYRSGQIALRGKNNGTWQSWRTVLDSSNYGGYVQNWFEDNQQDLEVGVAYRLGTARTINGTSFDATANITTANWGTARTINGTSVNGSANVTTANWGTTRTLTVGSTGKSVNGSANVSWTLAEIGAAATNSTNTVSGGLRSRLIGSTLYLTNNGTTAGG